MPKNIFCILFEFPPLNVAGVYRPLRFVNALAEADYNVTVLTIELDANYLETNPRIDNNLLNLVNEKINVIRIPIGKIEHSKNNLSSFYNSWKNSAGDRFYKLLSDDIKLKIENILVNNNSDLIFVSAPPFSMTLLGSNLSKKYNIPLVVDMRDAWLGWSMVPFPTYDYYLRRKILEKRVLKQATAILSVTPELIDKYKQDHPKINKDKFHLIYNSPNKKLIFKDVFRAEGIKENTQFHIGYSGSFYYTPDTSLKEKFKKPHRFLQYQKKIDNWKYRSPYYFFKAFKIFLENNYNFKDKVFFDYIGNPEPWLKEMILELELESNVIFHGVLPYHEVLELENKFDLLLATSEKTKGTNHYCLPSKLFNYINSAKPIIGFVTDGPQKDFIQNINCGIIINPDDSSKAASKIEDIITKGCQLKINIVAFEKYKIENTNSLFVNIITNSLYSHAQNH
jgi:glycosyltransferase involved in cell wall biosynthesis